MLVKYDKSNRKVRLLLKAEEILAIMNEKEEREKKNANATLASLWRPEVL